MPKLSRAEFYKKYYPLAVKYTKGTGIHPETLMAQMANESSWGATANPANGFAMFGIKGINYGGKTVDLDTTEQNKDGGFYKSKENFRAYESVEDSMKDYVTLIQNKYSGATKLETPEQQLQYIGSKGYGSKGYGEYTSGIVRQNKQFIPQNMGNENKTTAKIGGQDFTPNDNKESTEKIMAQLETYKQKAKDGTLTDEDYIRSQTLHRKANAILEGHEQNVFNSSYLKEVIKPYTTNGINKYGGDSINKINSLKTQLADAETTEQINSIESQINQEKESYKTASEKAKGITDEIGRIESEEQRIYSNEEKYSTDITNKPDGEFLRDADIKAGKGPALKKQMRENLHNKYVPEYADLYKNITGLNENIHKVKSETSPEYVEAVNTVTNGKGLGDMLGSGALSGSSQTKTITTTPVNTPAQPAFDARAAVNDMTFGENGEVVSSPYKPKTTDPNALRTELDENNKLLSDLNKPKTEQIYEPDTKSGTDWSGYLMDIGRVGLGIKGATEKLPDYKTTGMFDEYLSDAQQRQDMGMSPEEMGLAKNFAERGYGYDVKNIRGMSGGSAGVALGNLGRATGQLQDQYSKIGAQDQMIRRQNRQDFYQAANQAENVNQYKFGIDYQNAMQNKQAGASLVNDAFSNILNRRQYESSYGKGSQYYNYMKELTLGQQDANQINKDAQEQRKLESIAGIKTRNSEIEGLISGQTNSYNNTEDAANKVVPKEQLNTTGEPPLTNNTAGAGILSTYQKEGEVKAPNIKGEEVTTEAGTKYTPGGGIVTGEVYGKSKQVEVAPTDKASILELQKSGANVRELVKQNPEYKAEMQSVQDKIAVAKKKKLGASTDMSKTLDEQISELQKEIDKIDQKHEARIDKLFDEDGKYIGE